MPISNLTTKKPNTSRKPTFRESEPAKCPLLFQWPPSRLNTNALKKNSACCLPHPFKTLPAVHHFASQTPIPQSRTFRSTKKRKNTLKTTLWTKTQSFMSSNKTPSLMPSKTSYFCENVTNINCWIISKEKNIRFPKNIMRRLQSC